MDFRGSKSAFSRKNGFLLEALASRGLFLFWPLRGLSLSSLVEAAAGSGRGQSVEGRVLGKYSGWRRTARPRVLEMARMSSMLREGVEVMVGGWALILEALFVVNGEVT